MTNLVTCGVAHCHDAQAVAVTFPTGFKFSYSGDCRPSRHFARIGKGSTVVVHEATFDDDMQDDAEAKKHSTMSEAIGVAQAMGAKRLVLTHFSQRYQKIPQLGALDKIKIRFEDTENVSNGAEAAVPLMDTETIDTSNDPDDLLSEQRAPTPPPKALLDSPNSSRSSSMSLAPPEELKVAIAFDFLRVRAGEIEQLEYYTPVLQRMFEMLDAEEKAKAKDHPSEVARRKKEIAKEKKRQEIAKNQEIKEAQKLARIEKARQASKPHLDRRGSLLPVQDPEPQPASSAVTSSQ